MISVMSLMVMAGACAAARLGVAASESPDA